MPYVISNGADKPRTLDSTGRTLGGGETVTVDDLTDPFLAAQVTGRRLHARKVDAGGAAAVDPADDEADDVEAGAVDVIDDVIRDLAAGNDLYAYTVAELLDTYDAILAGDTDLAVPDVDPAPRAIRKADLVDLFYNLSDLAGPDEPAP